MIKIYENAKMDIILFDGESWVKAIASDNDLQIQASYDDENTLMTYKTYK